MSDPTTRSCEPPLHISTIRDERSSVRAEVLLTGEVDMATAPRLAEGLQTLLRTRVREIVVDASALGFIDSFGVTTLVRAATALARSGGHLEIRNADASVRRVIDLCHLEDVEGIRVTHRHPEIVTEPEP